VERVVSFRDAAIGARGSRVDLGRAFHGESFMGSFLIEFLQEGTPRSTPSSRFTVLFATPDSFRSRM